MAGQSLNHFTCHALIGRGLEQSQVLNLIDATDRDAIALGAEGKLCADTVLTIVRSTVFGLLQTREIALADPFVINKLRTFEVREWTVMEGSIGVTVNLSDQTLQLT